MPTFNLSYYRQLEQLVEEKESLLTGKDYFLDPTVQEWMDLEGSISNQIVYNHRKKYLALIQEYLNEKMTSNVLRAKLTTMVEEDLEKYSEISEEELSTFWIDLESKEFALSFDNIYETCLCAIEFDGEEGAMTETTFHDSIQKNFFKIQKYLDEE